MAEWLSSKLKVAEQFLQQIDHQAAESFGKPEKQRSDESIRSVEGKDGNHSRKFAEHYERNHLSQTYFLRQPVDIEKHQHSQPLLGLKKPVGSAYAQQRLENTSSMQRPKIKSQKLTGSKQLSAQVLGVEDSEKDRKDDWTELLASPDFSLVSSAASSTGSSDSGRVFAGVALSSNPFGTTGSDTDREQTATSAMRTFYYGPRHAASLSSQSKSHTNSVNGLRDSQTTTRNFRHENLRRRLELDAGYMKTSDREFQDLVTGDETSNIGNSGCVELDSHIIQATGEMPLAQVDLVLPSAKIVPEGTDSAIEEWKGPTVDGKVEKSFKAESEVFNNSAGDKEASRMLKSVCEDIPNSISELSACATESSSKLNQTETYVHSNTDIIGLSIGMSRNKEEQDPSHGESSGQDRLKDEENRDLDIVNHDDSESKNDQVEEINFYRPGNEVAKEASLEMNRQIQIRDDLDIAGQAERNREFIFLERSAGAPVHDTESYDSGTDTDTDSASGSDSELEEIERRRVSRRKGAEKKRALALAMAQAAQAAINEREGFVLKLEREKHTLENTLAEHEEQQAREEAELRMTTMEVLQSLDLEKQLHSSSRMKALARESRLENENAALAKSLAAVQWKLEEQMAKMGEARNMVETKEGSQAELERKIANLYQRLSGAVQTEEVELAGSVNAQEILFEEEQNSLWRNIEQYQIQVKELDKKIQCVKDLQHAPTDVEIELENRLAQLTDHLIQKQAQVEALSTEKATLVFRLEALSNAVQEERSSALSRNSRNRGPTSISNWPSIGEDLEYGVAKSRISKNQLSIYVGEEADAGVDVGSHPCLSLLRQLDALFLAGIYYFRRHRWAQVFAVLYIILLHLWVLFVLLMHSQPDQVARSQDLLLTKNASYSFSGFNATNSL